MALQNDRVGELLEGARHNKKTIATPEGVPLRVRVATHGERLSAFALDMFIMLGAILALSLALLFLFFSNTHLSLGMTLILFVAFLVRNLYFVHFELAWQGRTPGKRLCGLRVINRTGGELTPSAVIARNLTRELEVFFPLSLLFTLDPSAGAWQQLTLLGWASLITSLPFWNQEHLRAGDLLAGTQVISMPRRALLPDLTEEPAQVRRDARHVFTHEQLAVYGAFELQVLEEFLRRPDSKESTAQLEEISAKICRKIGWPDPVPPHTVRRFLTDFYTAERADLERGQLFGHLREDKRSGSSGGGAAFPAKD